MRERIYCWDGNDKEVWEFVLSYREGWAHPYWIYQERLTGDKLWATAKDHEEVASVIRSTGLVILDVETIKDPPPSFAAWFYSEGKELTEPMMQALADEAERGYDISHLKKRPTVDWEE